MIAFTLGVVAALLTGALVWMFVTLYKLKKKFNWMTDTWKDMAADQSRFMETYYRTREDDQTAAWRRLDDLQRYFDETYVKKEDLTVNKQGGKTLLKG
jgi:hypothetical protein